MDRELKLLVEDKAGRQLHSVITQLREAARARQLTDRADNPERFFPAMFVAHGFPTNPLSVEAIREKLRTDNLLQGDDVSPLELLDLDELDLLDATREATGETVAQILRGKGASPFFRSSITDYLLIGREVQVSDSSRLEALFHVAHRAALQAANDPSLAERLEDS